MEPAEWVLLVLSINEKQRASSIEIRMDRGILVTTETGPGETRVEGLPIRQYEWSLSEMVAHSWVHVPISSRM